MHGDLILTTSFFLTPDPYVHAKNVQQ
jgi:hypothetical protein